MHADGDAVLVWQAHSVAVGQAAIASGIVGGSTWSLRRTTRLRLSLPSLLARCGWARRPGRECVLGVWLRREAFDRYLCQAVLDERNEALYGTITGHRLATRWAQVVVSWHPDVDLSGRVLERETVRMGLRESALAAFLGGDVLRVEDWTGRVVAARDGGAALDIPEPVVYPLDDEATLRLTGAH